MNLDEFKAFGNRLLINYTDNRRPENFKELMLEWKRILEKHDAELVNKNLDEHLEKSVYFPKLAELVKQPEKDKGFRHHIPNAEETLLYIEEMRKEDNNGIPRERIQDYVERMKRGLMNEYQ